jgi:hypothetical protein
MHGELGAPDWYGVSRPLTPVSGVTHSLRRERARARSLVRARPDSLAHKGNGVGGPLFRICPVGHGQRVTQSHRLGRLWLDHGRSKDSDACAQAALLVVR